MASFKLNVVHRYGKYYSALYKATDAQGDPLSNPAQPSPEDLSKQVRAQIESLGLDEEEDSIIFRGVSYESFRQLENEVRMAKY